MAFHTRIRWITFDAFNTLFKIRGNVQDLYASEARRFCLNVSASDIKKNFGPVYKNHLKEFPFYGLAQGKTSRLWWRELVYKTFLNSGVPHQELDPTFEALFEALFTRFKSSEGYEVYKDVYPSLETLKQKGFRMGIISNSDERLCKSCTGYGGGSFA